MPINTTAAQNKPEPHFIVVVPGYMGSLLRDKTSGEIVWLDFGALLKNPFAIGPAIDNLLEKLMYPPPGSNIQNNLEPAGILNQVLVLPPLFKQEQYIRLLDKLQDWGYQVDPANPKPADLCAYTFSYDWRQDNRISGRQLGEFVRQKQALHPGAKAWLISHSNGGIISRWYIQKEGGKDQVAKMFYMASPWDGAPKALDVMLNGFEAMGLKSLNFFKLGSRMGDLIRSFPSFYQLIPHENPFLRNENNEVIDLFKDTRWLTSDQEKKFLADGLQFNLDLAGDPGVDTLCFYGVGKPTTTAGVASQKLDGGLGKIQWISTSSGDGTVPERSGNHPWLDKTDRLPFVSSHGDIYINDSVLEFLRVEMIGQLKGEKRDAIFLPDFSVIFEPDGSFFAPGDPVHVWAKINTNGSDESEKPISKATVKAWFVFRQPLPGSPAGAVPADTAPVKLVESKKRKGYYEATLPAPAENGYYDVIASVKIVKKPQINLKELIVIETA